MATTSNTTTSKVAEYGSKVDKYGVDMTKTYDTKPPPADTKPAQSWWQELSPETQKNVLDSYRKTSAGTAAGAKPATNPITGVPFSGSSPPPSGSGAQFGNQFWEAMGFEPDIFDMNTVAPNPGQAPEYDWYTGDGGPNVTTQQPQSADGNTFTMLNPDGSVTPGVVDPTTRDVMPEELVEERLSNLLRSDSKYIQDARRQGLEQANAAGGLGGTVGTGAAMTAALRTALPIAQSDAEAYRAAAAQNMDALNQFSQLNHQRATQLEMAQVDSRTKQLTTQISTSASMAAAMLESATQRDISRADNETKLRMQEMQGQIQDRLATTQFKYDALLNDAQYAAELAKTMMQGEFGLAGTGLQGQWNAEIQEQANAIQQEQMYITAYTGAYENYTNQIANLTGEMSDSARQAAIQSITNNFVSYTKLLEKLFPGATPITWGTPPA